jgi:hypothetical protein
MSFNQKYVYIEEGHTSAWNDLIIGNVYEIEKSFKTYGVYLYFPYYIPKYNLYIENSDLWYKFIPLETWREQQINKILENE